MSRVHAIPDRAPANIFDIVRHDMVVGRVVSRMLRTIPEGEGREAAVKDILSGIISYSSQKGFIQLVGYDEGRGHKLISKELWEHLETEFFAKVVAQQSKVPEQECGLANIYLSLAKKQCDDFRPIALRSIDAIRSLFGSAVSTATSETSTGVKQEQRLWWDGLIAIFDSEGNIKKAADKLRKVAGDTEVVQLVDKYLGGLRSTR